MMSGISIALVGVVIYISVAVAGALTKPQPFLEKYLEQNKDEMNKLAPQMAVTLEYESMAIRAHGIQISYGFVCGLIFLVVGLLLFVTCTVQAFKLSASSTPFELTLASAAPGLVPMIISGFLIGFSIQKDANRRFTAALELPTGAKGNLDAGRPPQKQVGVGAEQPKQ
jgi:hypothetical protein